MTTVHARQRFSARAPCPICGGHPRLPSGHGVRCYGFRSADGRFAHCTRDESAGALDAEPRSGTFAHRLDGSCRCGRSHGAGSPDFGQTVASGDPKANRAIAAEAMCPEDHREVRAYPWPNEQGTIQFETVRYEHLTEEQAKKPGKPRKTFKFRRPAPDKPGHVLPSRGDVPLVVFRKDRLTARPHDDLHWPEGEEHVLALEQFGLLATTTAGGAKGVRAYGPEELRDAARGRHVILHVDADPDGEAYAAFVARTIAPVARSIRMVPYDDCGPSGDVLDCIRNGATRDALERRIAATSLWQQKADARTQQAARLVVRTLVEVTPQPVQWLWPGWLARGKFHLFAGHPGDGKSSLTAAIAAIGSVGGPWPDGIPAPRFRTLFILGEDSLADTMRPRLDCFGADVSQIHALELVLDEQGRERFFDVCKHLDLLERAIDAYAIDLVVIDPLSSTLVGADRNAEGDMRDRLTPLVKAAERREVAVLGIAHTGKPTGATRTPLQRVLGSTGLVALARLVWMTAQDDEQRAFGVVKSNLAPKPASQAWSRDLDGPIVWHGPASQPIEDLLITATPKLPRADAEAFLREFLMGGSRPAREVESAAQDAGISMATLRRAADGIGVLKWKGGGPGTPWYWCLSNGSPTPAPSVDQTAAKVLTPKDAQVSIFAPSSENTKATAAHRASNGKDAHLSAFSGEHLTEPHGADAHLSHPMGEELLL